MNFSPSIQRLVRESLSLLRQDITIVSEENWVADKPIELAKAKIALDTAVSEVLNAFNWSDVANPEFIVESSITRGAVVYCLARELAIPIAGRSEDLKNFDALYRDKINQAKLNVVSLISATSPTDPNLQSSVKAMLTTIYDHAPMARQEVILAHDWNFAKVVEPASSSYQDNGTPYFYAADYPRRSLRLIAVYGHRGKLNEWKVENGYICAREPITSIHYIRDIQDLNRWTDLALGVYKLRVASTLARDMNLTKEFQTLEQLYRDALETAKLRDTRESNTPQDAWGDNVGVEQMLGRRQSTPWRPF